MRSPYRSSRWSKVRLLVLERDGHKCQIGGPKCQGLATQVDHIVPVRDGGPLFDLTNLRAACAWCNTWRAQNQKNGQGWRRSAAHIILVMGPPGSWEELSRYVNEHAQSGDLIIDYLSLSRAMGGTQDEVRKARSVLLRRVQRGDAQVRRVWITSTNPRAQDRFPHHEVVVLDPGRDTAVAGMGGWAGLVDDWYRARESREQGEW